jgi:DUF1009 family protein
MTIKNVEFWWEGLAKISKQTVVDVLKKYINENPEEDRTLEECIEILCEDGEFDIGDGIISVNMEIVGCLVEYWGEIQ